MKHIVDIINQNRPAMSLLAWFFLLLIFLVVGIIAATRFLFRTGKKGVQKARERRNSRSL
jgi:uncharacterized membrane protein